MTVTLKRAREPATPGDGYRVLVERLWPRGVRKVDLVLDAWLKDVAPSTELRKWFAHDPARWLEFKRRYRAELAKSPAVEAFEEIARHAARGALTLVFSSHDAVQNNAAVLAELLSARVEGRHARSEHAHHGA
jgi:uncharacterized protein YeaO (DUF488 family)